MLIRVSRDQHAFDHSPGLIAVFHALLRLLAPRHPPHALSSLAALIPPSSLRPRDMTLQIGTSSPDRQLLAPHPSGPVQEHYKSFDPFSLSSKDALLSISLSPRHPHDSPDMVPHADSIARRRFLVLQLYRYRIVKDIVADRCFRFATEA